MNYKTELLSKIADKSIKVGIIGLGYVGLPLGLEFTSKDIEVLGFDLDQKKVDDINNGKSYIKHIGQERIEKSVKAKKLKATADFSLLPSCDAIIICVPTPLNEHREPDMKYITSTADRIQKYLRPGQIVTLESTTYPGTTEEILLPLFEEATVVQGISKEKYVAGTDFFLAFSPEREDPNNPDFNTSTIPKVVGGITESCVEIACALYDQVIVETVPVSSPRVAEATKLLENIYRSINIALVNELKMVFERMNIDVWEVIEAAKTKPFGYNAFYPGPGLGGHCIPIDPFYLTWKAREYEVNTKFIELAGEINTYQPYYVVDKVSEALNSHQKSLNGSKVLVLGVAYKKNIDDMRESPSLKLIEILRDRGGIVDYNDPFIPTMPRTRKYEFDMNSVELSKENLDNYDLVLLSTDHDGYDYEMIYENSKLLVDTRNALKFKGNYNGKAIKA